MKDLKDLSSLQLNTHNAVKSSGSGSSSAKRTKWNVPITDFARLTHNPIRAIVEGLKIVPNPDKQLIALSIGDPTTFGNLKPAPEIIDALRSVVEDGSHNGYGPSTGFPEARQAVANYVSHQGNVTPNDVILWSGASCTLDLCLIPRPGFSIYRTLAEGFGVECRYYDLVQLESLIDANTAALIVTNPSNPCGSVFSKTHLEGILDIAEKHYLPIIADEIYEHFVFPGQEFYAVS